MEKHNCIEKVRQQIKDADDTIKYVLFDLANIKDTSIPNSEYKTGQRVSVEFNNKKKIEKSFVAHDYCPWCGVKYNADKIPNQ